jgi:hypothetical protein
MKIALVGEAPNDTQAIKNLLIKRYTKEKFDFVFLLQRINGSNLDSQKTKRFLRVEFENQKPDLVIFIRDLDALLSDKTNIEERKLYYTEFNSVVDKKGIYLLNIFEIEALILADIFTFNGMYQTNIETFLDVMLIQQPKELLKNASKNYNESHNAAIFEKLEFDKVMECKYFNEFIVKLDKYLN